jgi:hypothetical protein
MKANGSIETPKEIKIPNSNDCKDEIERINIIDIGWSMYADGIKFTDNGWDGNNLVNHDESIKCR